MVSPLIDPTNHDTNHYRDDDGDNDCYDDDDISRASEISNKGVASSNATICYLHRIIIIMMIIIIVMMNMIC